MKAPGHSLTQTMLRQTEIGALPHQVVGSVSSVGLAWLLRDLVSQIPKNRPILIITPDQEKSESVQDALDAFGLLEKSATMMAFDESPYGGLYPSSRYREQRMNFLWKASQKNSQIFVAPVEALLQNTLPQETFKKYLVELKVGDEIDSMILQSQLVECGYSPTPIVEDCGSFVRRGDIFDLFTPNYKFPLRISFFGDQIESIKLFDPDSQRTEASLDRAMVIPAREVIFNDDTLAVAFDRIPKVFSDGNVSTDKREALMLGLRNKVFFKNIDYFSPLFFEKLDSPLDYFGEAPLCIWLDELDIIRVADQVTADRSEEFDRVEKDGDIYFSPEKIYSPFSKLRERLAPHSFLFSKVMLDSANVSEDSETPNHSEYKTLSLGDFSTRVQADRETKKDFFKTACDLISAWKEQKQRVFLFSPATTQIQRLEHLFSTNGVSFKLVDGGADKPLMFDQYILEQDEKRTTLHLIPRWLPEGVRLPTENIIFLKDDDIFGEKRHTTTPSKKRKLPPQRFSDLSPGDLVVHELHGIAAYEGLKKVSVGGIENEFLYLRFKDNDKLYLPIYRIAQIQKFSSPGGTAALDKLGGTSWQKAKVKVRASLRDIANDLLQLYARRQSLPGYKFSEPDMAYEEFEALFPYEETPDQAKAIADVIKDMTTAKPMDRLVCGDVGFGKTEVAIRAAFKAAQDGKQTAVLVPTTILAFQHFQTFQKRFKDSAIKVASLSRFSSTAEAKQAVLELKEGKVDVIIGTHRLLSKDVEFKDLGLLVIDEEQKFGVTHKEKIKRFKTQVDVLTLSATPIPRSLNMSLLGIRDLSLIATPPVDRLSIRTFVTRFEESTIRKAILSEIQRGGQVFFIHNRVQSIYGLADELRAIVPEARMRVGHGQMDEAELEKTMLDFYNHEFDVLLATTIIESGLDIPRANTIIVDRADTFGLSQLYQLRGRVGRSKDRAYAYLLLPEKGAVDPTAQERLKILQDHAELGSGFQIAHHDLELRGGGNILGDDQSGHINTVGYELYMELLAEVLSEARGEEVHEVVEPEINLKVQALIPDDYIEDIRIRLSYYRALSQIETEADLDIIEEELVDRFGGLPPPVVNLFGLMLIRSMCRALGVRDLSGGGKSFSLAFTNQTIAKPEKLVKLATSRPEKFQIMPDSRLIVKANPENWSAIVEELKQIEKFLI